MNSCLYHCHVMHHRLEPRRNAFHYSVFMFYIDLDEINGLVKKLLPVSYNRWNVFNFRDQDHIQLPVEHPDKSKTVKQHIITYLQQNGVDWEGGRIMLLTNLCTFGYQFNPVSFFYFFDNRNEPKYVVVEVGNTFGEKKPYLLRWEDRKEDQFYRQVAKHFYVSPFIDLDSYFDFNIQVPGEKLNIKIDDYKDGKRFFLSTLTGKRKPLNNAQLLWYSFRFPFITLKVISLIHWQALVLWLKGIPYHKKNANMHLQKEVFKR